MSGKNNMLGLTEAKKAEFLDMFILMSIKTSCSKELSMKKVFVTSGPDLINTDNSIPNIVWKNKQQQTVDKKSKKMSQNETGIVV